MIGEEPPTNTFEGHVGWSPDYESPRPKAFDINYERYKKSKKAEQRVAEKLRARALPRSGGLPWSKSDGTTAQGDITSISLHIEHKRVEPQTKSVGIKREWLAKVTSGANRRTKIPAMAIMFEEAEGHAQDWLMMPLEFAERLLRLMEEDG